jgi:hypothetical protein
VTRRRHRAGRRSPRRDRSRSIRDRGGAPRRPLVLRLPATRGSRDRPPQLAGHRSSRSCPHARCCPPSDPWRRRLGRRPSLPRRLGRRQARAGAAGSRSSVWTRARRRQRPRARRDSASRSSPSSALLTPGSRALTAPLGDCGGSLQGGAPARRAAVDSAQRAVDRRGAFARDPFKHASTGGCKALCRLTGGLS